MRGAQPDIHDDLLAELKAFTKGGRRRRESVSEESASKKLAAAQENSDGRQEGGDKNVDGTAASAPAAKNNAPQVWTHFFDQDANYMQERAFW